ncbi:hypothetical protein ABBQ38_007475 [Trebouxia sp. C0009 RCD-2024]
MQAHRAATILARPLPRDVGEQHVQGLFAGYGRILRVRLRFQQSNLQQKDSAYVEFADTASADAAVASPPLQPGSSSKALECLHKQDYEKHQRSVLQSISAGTSTGKRKQGSADSTGDNAGDFGMDLEQLRKRSKTTSDKAKQIHELQVALQKEQAASAQLKEVTKQARQKEAEAIKLAKQAQNELISKGVELASVKGQLDAANRRANMKADQVHAQYRPKIQNLEAQIQQVKNALETELSKHTKRTTPKFEL